MSKIPRRFRTAAPEGSLAGWAIANTAAADAQPELTVAPVWYVRLPGEWVAISARDTRTYPYPFQVATRAGNVFRTKTAAQLTLAFVILGGRTPPQL